MNQVAAEQNTQAMPQYSADDIIPPSAWGKDHWSTLAYVDTVMTDCGGFQLGYDPRMRSTRRNLRVMLEQCKNPRRTGGRLPAARGPGPTEAATRLQGGQEVTGHDDWSCLQDMAAVGLLDTHPDKLEPGVTVRFSPKGSAWVSALRTYKQQGGQFAQFSSAGLPEMAEHIPGPRETFTWFNYEFDISAILADLASGKLRPKRTTMDKDFIAGYAVSVLGVSLERRDEDQKGSFLMHISTNHAKALPEAAFGQPVVVAYLKKGKGTLNLDGTPDYLLVDGNHRMARAYLDARESVDVVILSAAQTRKYRS